MAAAVDLSTIYRPIELSKDSRRGEEGNGGMKGIPKRGGGEAWRIAEQFGQVVR